MPPANLSANLPWQNLQAQSNAFAGLGGDPQAAMAGLGQSYAGNYGAALGLNAGLFSQTQTGYEGLRGQLDSQYADISKGYSDLYGDVLGRIAGSNQSNIQDINSQYDSAAGSQMQGAISRGLGNSTVQQNMQRGVEMDRARAITGSQNQFAQLGAGYAASIGGQGLQAQQQGAQTQANLGVDQLRFLGSTNIPYPNAQMYSQMAQMYGGNIEAQRNRQDLAQQQKSMRGMGVMSAGAGVSGGSNGFPAQRTPSAFDYGATYGGGGGSFGALSGGGGYGGVDPRAMQLAQQGGFQGGFDKSGFSGGDYSGGFGQSEGSYEGTGEGTNYYDSLYSGGPSTGSYNSDSFMG